MFKAVVVNMGFVSLCYLRCRDLTVRTGQSQYLMSAGFHRTGLMDIVRGIKLSSSFISATNWINPSAVTWVGVGMIARIKVNMNFFNLKSYTWIAYAVMVEK